MWEVLDLSNSCICKYTRAFLCCVVETGVCYFDHPCQCIQYRHKITRYKSTELFNEPLIHFLCCLANFEWLAVVYAVVILYTGLWKLHENMAAIWKFDFYDKNNVCGGLKVSVSKLKL